MEFTKLLDLNGRLCIIYNKRYSRFFEYSGKNNIIRCENIFGEINIFHFLSIITFYNMSAHVVFYKYISYTRNPFPFIYITWTFATIFSIPVQSKKVFVISSEKKTVNSTHVMINIQSSACRNIKFFSKLPRLLSNYNVKYYIFSVDFAKIKLKRVPILCYVLSLTIDTRCPLLSIYAL